MVKMAGEGLELPGQVVLVLQGGGALGAYQVGVFQAMHEAGIEPDWVIGTSIGALNGAIIAGNPPAGRMRRLDAFWDRVRNGAEIDRTGDVERDRVQASDPKQLLHQTVHPRGVLPELGNVAIARQMLERCGEDGEGSAQLVRRIGGELALNCESFLQAIQGLVHRCHQRLDFSRGMLLR